MTLADSENPGRRHRVWWSAIPRWARRSRWASCPPRAGGKPGPLESVSGYEDFIQTDAAINIRHFMGAHRRGGPAFGYQQRHHLPRAATTFGIGPRSQSTFARFVLDSPRRRARWRAAPWRLEARPSRRTSWSSLAPRATRGAVITDVDPESPAEKGWPPAHRCGGRHQRPRSQHREELRLPRRAGRTGCHGEFMSCATASRLRSR